ncbi:MAG: adenylate kinase [Pseudomonadota bacterium]
MNILFFGPNGSGKGTQGKILKEKYNIAHVESGLIFRDNIKGGTELGKKAKEYIDRGDLVPDEITIPMMVDRIKKDDCKKGWLLDGFPRNKVQSEKLHAALEEQGIKLTYVIEMILDRQVAKNRIMGRRLCEKDNNHPNNIFIDAIKPNGDKCRVCGGGLSARADDQDETAIDKRHSIYYDTDTGTLASSYYWRDLADKDFKYFTLNGEQPLPDVTAELISNL